jgi:hypothetical protein
MNVPTIPTLSRLSKTQKYSAAGVAAGSAVVLAVTGLSGTAGMASAAQQTPVLAAHGVTPTAGTTTAVQHTDWTPDAAGQQKSVSAQADAAQKHAVQDAAKKKAAQEAARKTLQADAAKRAEVKQAANRSQPREAITVRTVALTSPSGSPQQIARHLIGNSTQFQCFSNIVSRESGWNHHAVNASSGAYGLVQALPGTKMASAGADWRNNPTTQIKWGLSYMDSRYGSPCAAWSFWQAHNWY